MNSAFKIKMRITVTVKAVMRTRKARGAYPPKKEKKYYVGCVRAVK